MQPKISVVFLLWMLTCLCQDISDWPLEKQRPITECILLLLLSVWHSTPALQWVILY